MKLKKQISYIKATLNIRFIASAAVAILSQWLIIPGAIAIPTVAEADSAYLSGQYSIAVELYKEIAEESGVSAPLLFNLGNAYMKQDDFANAMLCYQRAKKLDPSNKHINNNIRYLSGKVEDANKAEQRDKKKRVAEDTPNFFQTIHTSVASNTSSNAWAGWAAAFFILFAGCACLYLFTSSEITRKFGFFGGIAFIFISMVCLVCAYSSAAEFDSHEHGVIMAFKTSLLTEPNVKSDSGQTEGVLTRGTKVRIVAEETDAEGNVNWIKVRLNSDYIGWVEAKDVAVI